MEICLRQNIHLWKGRHYSLKASFHFFKKVDDVEKNSANVKIILQVTKYQQYTYTTYLWDTFALSLFAKCVLPIVLLSTSTFSVIDTYDRWTPLKSLNWKVTFPQE